jgi:hypothetical protein
MLRKPRYHGHANDTTAWGASVVLDDDGRYYAFVAQMTNGCDLGEWRTNSEIILAVADDPLGPFEYVQDVVRPWAHNPQVIRVNDSELGPLYALYALGDGVPLAPEQNCSRRLGAEGANLSRANFTIHYAPHPTGPWAAWNASIEDWPQDWDYGASGNWNPAPLARPDGSVYLMAHTSLAAFGSYLVSG